MNTQYDSDIDFLEVMESGHRTVGENVTASLTLFYTEDSHRLVGFCLEAASAHLDDLARVPYQMRLAGLVRLMRGVMGVSQGELAMRVDVGERTLQRIESGDGNPTFEALINLTDAAPKTLDFSVLLRRDP